MSDTTEGIPCNTVFGLEVGWVLSADETPLEVLGCVKYLDADGRPDYYNFSSDTLSTVEAMGMAQYLDMQQKADAETSIMMSCTIDDDDD